MSRTRKPKRRVKLPRRSGESRHAEELRKRGFQKTQTLIGTKRSRSGDPMFSATELMTMATDDTGQNWMAKGVHDLTDLGFRDGSRDLRELGERLGIFKKPQ